MRFYLVFLLALTVLAAGCIQGSQTEPLQGTEPTTTVKAAADTSTTLENPSTTITVEEEEAPPTTTIRVPFNITDCSTLDNSSVRDACFYDAANRVKDMSLCDRVQSNNVKLKCKARLEENADYCDGIDLQVEKDWCYRTMAFKWNNLKYCKDIYYAQIRDKCILDYVKDKKPDPYECFQISDSEMRDDCIYHHIDLYNSTGAGIKPTLCGLINNMTLEIKCNRTYLNQKF